MRDPGGILRWRALLLAAGFATIWSSAVLSQPASLERHTAIYDPIRQRMVVYGGYIGTRATSESWQLSLAGAPLWSPLASEGYSPPARLGHSAVYDQVRDRMIVFGGLDSLFGSVLNDAWALTLSDPPTWSNLLPTDAPPSPRRYQSAIYDPVRDRVVVFGGSAINGIPSREVWSLWLTPTPRWEQVFPAGGPPGSRFSHSAIYDPVRDRMLVYGGGLPVLKDVWALSLDPGNPAWTLLQPPDDPRLRRLGHSAAYDPVLDRMVVFGGNDGNQPFGDVWALSLTGSPAWTIVPFTGETPSARAFHSAVHDAPSHRMIAFGGFPSVTEPTWGLSLADPMRWSPFRPTLAVSPGTLQFPRPVTIGDTASVAFDVSNIGLSPLDVTDFRLPPPAVGLGARLNLPGPFPLDWNVAVTESLFLAPSVPGVTLDSVVIVSGDPLAPRRSMDLSVDVLGLDFDTRVLGEPVEAPLGVSFIVIVTPRSGVRIEQGTLHYAIADGAGVFVPLPLTPLATDFIAAVPAAAVTEHGVEFYVTVENSGFSAAQPAGAPSARFTQPVARPDTIAAIPRPTSGTEFLTGRAIEVEVVLPAGAVFVSGTLHYRRGGEQASASVALAPGGALNRPAAIIPEDIVGPRGVEYWVDVNTVTAALRFPATDPTTDVIRIKVQDLAEGFEHPAGRYRLLSVPLDFGTDFSGSLDALLADQLGPYDPVSWRAYAFDAGSQTSVEFSPGTSAQLRPAPGRGFWLISLGPHRVDTRPIDGFSTLTGADLEIPLAAGWNLIGDPFDFPVEWAAVQRDPLVVGDPVAFDPMLGTIGDYAVGSPTVLTPFEAYFVHATQAVSIRVPPLAAPAPVVNGVAEPPGTRATDPRAARVDAAGSWRYRLRAWTARAVDGTNEFGVDAASEPGPDPLDQRKPPPPPGPWVRVAFAHSDWGERSGAYRCDLRAPGSVGERWEVEVRSDTAGDPIMLDLSEIVVPSPGLVMRLIDREQGTVVEPSGAAAVATPALAGGPGGYRLVSFGSQPYRLTIVAGSEAYVAEATRLALTVPSRMTLDSNAPNPFRAATRIRFGLSRTEHVSLEIYNVLGQRVWAAPAREPFEAGFHTIVWDGMTAAGGDAPSGVYLLRMTVGADALTQRIVRIQ